MTQDEHLQTHDRQIADIMQALGRLATAAERHADAVDDSDKRIEALILIAEKHAAELDRQAGETRALRALVDDVTRQWQAYINTLPRH